MAHRARRLAVMAVLLAAGLLGLLGYGPLSERQAGQPGTLTVTYDRLQRASARRAHIASPSRPRWHATAPSLARDGVSRLRFDNTRLEKTDIQSINPQREHVRSGTGYTEYEFAMDAGKGPPARIQFRLQQTTFGHMRNNVTADGLATPLVIDQFTFP